MTAFSQIGYVVEDIDEALAYWVDIVGVAPFFVYRDFELAECSYEGEPISQVISVAFAQAGPVQVELIEQHGDTRSAYLGQASGHAHHVAVWTSDYERDVDAYRARGLVDVQWGTASGKPDERFVYLAPSGPGPMIEVVEVFEPKARTYRAIAEAARTYDGSEPVRDASRIPTLTTQGGST
jgi:hypothetical protein